MKRLNILVAAVALAISTVACGPSDTVTNRNVKAKLLDASQETRQVFVMTKGGVVTLSGIVETPKAKALAVRLAHETNGVADVIDLIEVEGPAATTGKK